MAKFQCQSPDFVRSGGWLWWCNCNKLKTDSLLIFYEKGITLYFMLVQLGRGDSNKLANGVDLRIFYPLQHKSSRCSIMTAEDRTWFLIWSCFQQPVCRKRDYDIRPVPVKWNLWEHISNKTKCWIYPDLQCFRGNWDNHGNHSTEKQRIDANGIDLDSNSTYLWPGSKQWLEISEKANHLVGTKYPLWLPLMSDNNHTTVALSRWHSRAPAKRIGRLWSQQWAMTMKIFRHLQMLLRGMPACAAEVPHAPLPGTDILRLKTGMGTLAGRTCQFLAGGLFVVGAPYDDPKLPSQWLTVTILHNAATAARNGLIKKHRWKISWKWKPVPTVNIRTPLQHADWMPLNLNHRSSGYNCFHFGKAGVVIRRQHRRTFTVR